MRFTGQFTGARLDLIKTKALWHDYLKDKLHDMLKAWLTGVTGRVPVWSGMARGSLLELKELINGTLIITPRAGIKSRIPEGRSLGQATPTYGPTKYIIEVATQVPHYALQEFVNVGISKSAPWLSFQSGFIAARASLIGFILPAPIITKITFKV